MHYTADQLERLDSVYFSWPPGWHSVESRCGRFLAHVLVIDGEIKEFLLDGPQDPC